MGYNIQTKESGEELGCTKNVPDFPIQKTYKLQHVGGMRCILLGRQHQFVTIILQTFLNYFIDRKRKKTQVNPSSFGRTAASWKDSVKTGGICEAKVCIQTTNAKFSEAEGRIPCANTELQLRRND